MKIAPLRCPADNISRALLRNREQVTNRWSLPMMKTLKSAGTISLK